MGFIEAQGKYARWFYRPIRQGLRHGLWKQPHKIPQRIARQAQEIMEYQLELIHIPGKANSHADMLSRCPNYNQGDEDNKEVVVLPESMFIRSSHTISYIPEEPPEQNEATLKPWCKDHTARTIKTTTYLTPAIQTQQHRDTSVVTSLRPRQASRCAIEPRGSL